MKTLLALSAICLTGVAVFGQQPAPSPSPVIREEVTVSAGEAQTIDQVSKTVDVIDGQQMRDRADFTLVDSLRTIPGFRVQQSGGFGRLATIKTRGLRNQDTAVLIDGVRFRDPTAISGDATSFLSDLTLTSVSEVEVLRGSGSSLYGTNAIGGVIDFQTPRAQNGTHGQISGAAGGLGLVRFRGNFSHGWQRGGITAGGSRTVYAKGIDGNDHAHNTNLQTRIDVNPGSKTSFSGKIFFSDANVKLNSDPDTVGVLPLSNSTIINAQRGVNFTPDSDDQDRLQKSRFFSGQVSATQVLTDHLVLNGYYQGLSTKRRNVNGPLGAGFQPFGVTQTSIFDGQTHTANAHVTWTPSGSHNTLTGAYEFELEKFRNDGLTTSGTQNFFTTAGQRSHTFYAQDLVSLLDGNLQLAGGLRLQRYSLTRPSFSLTNAPYSNIVLDNPPTAVTFDGAVSYFVKKSGTKFRAHVGNGYRVPSLYERFGTFFSTFPSNSFIAIGDPFLKPEKTIAYDAGVEQYAAKEKVRLSSTYFYTKLIDVIGYGNVVQNIGTTSRPFGGYENQKGGHAQGGEFSAKAVVSKNTDIFASYTFTQSRQLTPQVSGSGVLKTLGVPDHQFTAVVTQRFGRAWVNFDFLATSTYLAPIFSNSTFNTYIYRFKGNRRGDLTGGYTFGFRKEKLTLRVYGTIENVFGQECFENGFRTIGRTARAGTTFAF
ncbi:MAG: TonB-dependent receptor plug domain-containing protein [Acidobacteria bacterium]|nr:TonB-dependent receptor plug domain-containing protein [Acidobacteriota bacterium]